MIYYGNPCGSEAIEAAMMDRMIGCITTPTQGNVVFPEDWDVVADNGCFGDQWEERSWLSWLTDQPRSIKWAVAPDVYDPSGAPCHKPTLERWKRYAPMMRRHGFTPAFVLQVGATVDNVPQDAKVLFIGGTDEYKLGLDAAAIAADAKRRGCQVHMGRVNSRKRIRYADSIGCDSADGTYLTFGPDKNLPRALSWIRGIRASTQLVLPLTCQ